MADFTQFCFNCLDPRTTQGHAFMFALGVCFLNDVLIDVWKNRRG